VRRSSDTTPRERTRRRRRHAAPLRGIQRKRAIVEALVAYGADWDAAKDDGKTPRDLARECGHDDLLEIAGSDARPS
jgi:hypothetical protein